MIDTVNKYEFIDAFNKMGRGEQFSHFGLIALFDYLEMLEDDIGEPIELDVIAICCEYSEYGDLEDYQNQNGFSQRYSDFTYESIADETTLIRIENTDGFIVQNC
tara:strand:+ start:231 stop:545 length:315 start_codon:yes stop_codon:yes gene_type:complete